jgi:putative SOS response-associated peptidase YedK
VCSNYIPVTSSDRMLAFFGVERARDDLPADVWPTGLAPFLRLAQDGSGRWVADDGLFGLLPHFAVEVAQGRRTYNARTETVATLPSFRQSWSRGWRCIIPADAIYEPNWESGKAQRWVIYQDGGVPMGIAGIYCKWRHPDGSEHFTFAMLTINADAHPLMRRFHRPQDEKRMVVILSPQDYGAWLACPVQEAPRFFVPWQGLLRADASPLPPRTPKVAAAPVPTRRPPAPPAPTAAPRTGDLF